MTNEDLILSKLKSRKMKFNKRQFRDAFTITFWVMLALSQSGCVTIASTSTAASPSLVIDPLSSDQIDVEYSRVSVEIERQSFAGFMGGVNPQVDTRVSKLDFQNGNKRGSLNARAVNALVLISGISSWFSISSGIYAASPSAAATDAVNAMTFAAILGLPVAMFVNERIWAKTNSERVRAFGQQALIDKERGDFYCLPNEEIRFSTRLLKTDWSYSAEMLSGRYSIKGEEELDVSSSDTKTRITTKESKASDNFVVPTESAPQQDFEQDRQQKKVDEKRCFVFFKGQWLEGTLVKSYYHGDGRAFYDVAFDYYGRRRTRSFNDSTFSWMDQRIKVGDSVSFSNGADFVQGTVIGVLQTPNGRVAEVRCEIDGKETTYTIPELSLKKVVGNAEE